MPVGYSSDLAYIHDVGHAAFAEQAAPGLLEHLQAAGLRRGLVVDLGCGSGQWAARLVAAGYDVLGIDISPGMVRLARRRAPQARFRIGSFLSSSIPPCVAVTSIGECLGYAFDPRHGEAALVQLFARVHAALVPGGLFIFDFLEPAPRQPSRNAQRWRKGADWAVLVTIREDAAKRQLTREITSFRQVGKLYRRTDEVHCVQLWERKLLAGVLRKQGFAVRVISGYGELRFGPGQVGFLARKR